MKSETSRQSPAALSKLFHTQLVPKIAVLEDIRRKAQKEWILVGALGLTGVVFATVFPMFVTKTIGYWSWLAAAIFLLLAFLVFLNREASRLYTKRYKDEFVREVIKLVLPEIQYHPEDFISEATYMESGLFAEAPDRYTGDDMASGHVGKTSIHLSEVHAEVKREHNYKGRRTEVWITQFRGFFMMADFHKNFAGRTYVLPDSTGKMGILNKITDSFSETFSGKGELVKLENVEFEAAFKVLSTDQVTARYILTPAMMEGILKVQRTFGGESMYLSFCNGTVYIGITQSENNFEPSLFRNRINIENAMLIKESFQNLFQIVDELDLNTRIWTKR